ncbi:MAG: hypothetical protein GX800_03240 [Clostridiaceae bacterium]|jgi:cell division protein FtsB|nr:hypothetical protein [Clostridiaceae bacterium]
MRKAPSSKNKKQINKNKKVQFVLILLALGYISSVLITQQIEFESKKKALRHIAGQIEQQQQIKEELDRKIELVQTREYLEKAAREQLGYARPDEIIFYDTTMKE